MSKQAIVFGGKRGLLGQALVRELQANDCQVLALGSEDIDLDSLADLQTLMHRQHPDLVFNALAYTQVDQAEDEPKLARQLNQGLPCRLARALPAKDITFVHFSTDFVFDGQKQSPYTPQDHPQPLNTYGSTKHEGEKGLQLLGLKALYVVRSAWLFGPDKDNFVTSILEQAQAKSRLRVIHDQVGSPTSTLDLARHCLQMCQQAPPGTYHIVNSGQASWCELASEVLSLTGHTCQIEAITSRDLGQNAQRPTYSVLDSSDFSEATGIKPRPWPQALRDYIYLLVEAEGSTH